MAALNPTRWRDRLSSPALWPGIGLGLRVLAALAVQPFARSRAKRCLFDDTNICCARARPIRAGGPYVVEPWGVPHYALRTPGYPLFLAACQAAFGDGPGSLLAVRLVQAVLGTACVWLMHRLVRTIHSDEPGRAWTASRLAAAWV